MSNSRSWQTVTLLLTSAFLTLGTTDAVRAENFQLPGIRIIGRVESDTANQILSSLHFIAKATTVIREPEAVIGFFIGPGVISNTQITEPYLRGFPDESRRKLSSLSLDKDGCNFLVVGHTNEQPEFIVVADTDHTERSDLERCLLTAIARAYGMDKTHMRSLPNKKLAMFILGAM